MRKKWIASFLMGACSLAPRAARAEIWTGGRIGKVSALDTQAEALGAVLRKFTASPDANMAMFQHELPTLNALSKLDSSNLGNQVIVCWVADAVMDSIKQLDRSFTDDFYNYRDPSDALVKAKKWGMLNRVVQSPAFSWWFSGQERAYIQRGADFYQSWLSKEKEDRRQELEQSMHGIELALNGNLPAQLAEAEIPAVDARAARIEHTDKVALAVSRALNEGLEALAAAPPNPTLLAEAQALIEELKRFPNSDREEEIAQKLIALVRQNPRDEALQMAIAQGIIGLEQYIGGHPGSYVGVLTDLENDLTSDSAYKLVEAELRRELHLGDPATLAELDRLNKEDDGQMAARAQLLITKLGQTYEESAKDRLAHRLIDLMRLNPTNKALQIMVAHGIVNNYHEDRINHRYQILRDARHAPYFHEAQLILWDAFMIEEAKTLSWWQKLLRYAQDWF